MNVIPTGIEGLLIIEPRVFADTRGFFLESWNSRTFAEIGLEMNFVQDNHSRSARGVLRGLHFQHPNPQGKLVRVTAGRAWDAAVDLRAGSATLGCSFGMELSAQNQRMIWISPGFAHGFLSLEDGTDVLYKCTTFYNPTHEYSIIWNDPDLSIDWPLDGLEPQMSVKDANGISLRALRAFA